MLDKLYATSQYVGLVLRNDEFASILGEDEDLTYSEYAELLEHHFNEVGNGIGGFMLSGDDCDELDVSWILEDGTTKESGYDTDWDFFIIPCLKRPSIFNDGYNSYAELKAELVKNYSKKLPPDFDWDNHIMVIQWVNVYEVY